MIKKLSKRIFLLIMVSLSIIILGIVILFAILNYNNTINTATSMMNRFVGGEPRRNPDEGNEPDKSEEDKIKPDINIDGLYYFIVENSTIIQNPDISYDEKIEEYAIKVAEKNDSKGIIENYIYSVRKIGENRVSVMLLENENAILHIRTIWISSVIISSVSIIIIYIIAKKLSKVIVKPVEETFEKQKQFISDASHELKTPLAVIEANADVLENELGTNKWMGYIQSEIESMDKLINELLLLAKIENIDSLREYNKFDLSNEIEIILSMFESMAYEKKVIIKSNIEENIMMNGEKEDIKHIVSILIDNAIKHTEANREVIVELSGQKNEIILQVKNEGNEIPEEERERIFERFYRIDKSRNRQEKRYGLGLAIAKSIVEKYNGKIEVLYKDGFTIFKVLIPN